jgi:GT2 family glycosyltransferase
MKLGVVTVTYNSSAVIEDFLRCCEKQTYKDFLLIIVDNNSSDNTLGVIQSFQDRLKIKSAAESINHGVALGNNIGIIHALQHSADYILLINNDVTFESTFFEQLIISLGKRADVAAVVPKMNFFDHSDVIWYGGGKFTYWKGPMAKHLQFGKKDNCRHQEAFFVDYAPTCAMLLRSETFQEIGLMDEKYFVYYDDTDFCFRMKKNGKRILFVPSIVLLHKVSILTGGEKSAFAIRMFSRNQIYFMRKHFHSIACLFFYIVIQLKNLLRFILGKDNLADYKLRMDSIREGFRMKM